MSKEAVIKIREAEETAHNIVNNAYETSRKMVIDAENNAKSECDDFEVGIKAEYKASLDEVKREVQEIIDRNNLENQKKYAEREQVVHERVKDAVKVILQGVNLECQ